MFYDYLSMNSLLSNALINTAINVALYIACCEVFLILIDIYIVIKLRYEIFDTFARYKLDTNFQREQKKDDNTKMILLW